MWSSRSFVCHREKSIQLAIAHPLEQTSSKRAKITWTNFISHVRESQHNSYLTSLASAKNNKYSCKQSGADDVSATGKCPVFHLNSYEWKKNKSRKADWMWDVCLFNWSLRVVFRIEISVFWDCVNISTNYIVSRVSNRSAAAVATELILFTVENDGKSHHWNAHFRTTESEWSNLILKANLF